MTLDERSGALVVALAAATWGTWKLWLVGPALDPSAQGALVLTVAGVVATAIGLARERRLPQVSGRVWALLAVFSVSEAANYLLYFRALGAGDSAAAAVTHDLAPALVALASPFLGQPVGRRTALAVPVAFLATAALLWSPGATGISVAAALGAASAVFYAVNVFLAKSLSVSFSPWLLVGLHDLAAAPFVWAGSSTPPWNASAAELGRATVGALLGAVLAAAAFMAGLRVIPPARAAVLAYLEPLVAALVAVVFLGEPMTPLRAGAMAVILGAGVVVALDRPAGAGNSADSGARAR